MRFSDYLAERGETVAAFARRAGLPASTLHDVVNAAATPRADTALAIISASRAEPTQSGGTVTLDDLVRSADLANTVGPHA